MSKRRKKQARRKLTITLLILVCAALVFTIGFFLIKMGSRSANDKSILETSDSSSQSDAQRISEMIEDVASKTEEIIIETPTPEPTLAPVTPISGDLLVSEYGYMVRATDGSVVMDKNSLDRIYPASMTKVMSALVFLDYLTDMDEKLEVSGDVIASLVEQGSSRAGFEPGETVSVRDLLYGALLPSGGDACVTLANRVAGSEEAFAGLMNQKGAELGLTASNFTNSTGLDDENQYTTCQDMAVIFQAALENKTFYNVITTRSYTCEPTEQHPDGLTFNSTMLAMMDENVMDNGAVILGGKTGTTDAAGYCLASFGRFDGQIYVLVTALASYSTDHGNITDARTAYGALQ